MYLFYDVETTGVPKDYKAKMHDLDNWPRCAQLAWVVYDNNRKLVAEHTHLILPDGWTIPKEPFFINNGMSTERNMKDGQPIAMVLHNFIFDLLLSDYMIAHNLNFDFNVVGAEMIRAGLKSGKKLKGICTMQSTIEFCNLPGKYGKKFPKLSELYEILFKKELEDAHDALGDVKSTALCFFELLDRKIITL